METPETDLDLIKVCPSVLQAHDSGLVLLSAGLAYWVIPHSVGYALMTEPGTEPDARHLLSLDPLMRGSPPPFPPVRTATPITPLVLFWVLIGGLTVLAWASEPELTGRGFLLPDNVVSLSEGWRPVTALSLHADSAHLVANLIAGLAVTAALAQWIGNGGALMACLSAGILGNILTLLLRYPSSVASLGASTAVFGALGVLCAMPGIFRGQSPSARKWVPLATGLVVLGIYGAGDTRTDVLAHACGFAAGWLIGRLKNLPSRLGGPSFPEPVRLILAFLVLPLAWLWALLPVS